MHVLQVAKEATTSRRTARMLRVLPITYRIFLCKDHFAQREVPKWLQPFQSGAPRSGPGALTSCDVFHSPEYWTFSKFTGVGHCALEFR